MAKTKAKAPVQTFSSFVQAAVFDPPQARRMIQERRDLLTTTNGSGETALAYVVIENYLETAQFLLGLGADVNTRDMGGETPLIYAAGLGYGEMVTLLLERGAEVDAQDQQGETSLFKAVRYGHTEVCEALLAAGAGMGIRNDMDQGLADVVLPRKKDMILSALTRHGYREPAEH